jgi:hypothetical protein
MVGMIGHLGQVSPKRASRCAILHLAGLSLGGGAAGIFLGLVGSAIRSAAHRRGVAFPDQAVIMGMGAVALVCGLRELGALRFCLLQAKRQVSRALWYTRGTYRASFLWGLELGVGLATFIQYPIYYVVLAVALAGTPLSGGLMLATAGLGQGLVLLVRTAQLASRSGEHGRAEEWVARAHRLAGRASLAFAGCLFAAGASGRAGGLWGL